MSGLADFDVAEFRGLPGPSVAAGTETPEERRQRKYRRRNYLRRCENARSELVKRYRKIPKKFYPDDPDYPR
jgi:hypothetical protein